MIIYTHQECLLKFNGKDHPERKERLISVLNSIKKIKEFEISIKNAPYSEIENISLVHTKKYIENIFSLIPREGLIGVEKEPYADTKLCPYSKNAILRSVGAGIAAADDIFTKNIDKVFCAIRPPGHHAETKRANGFCFFNNVAITAKYLKNKYKINKIAILDFDVHHGNGTQEIFFEDKTVFYGSIHESPLFPGTGFKNEVGEGNIFNAPIKSGTNGDEFIKVFKDQILDHLNIFKPEVILISAGFDAHYRDPLANINLESKDFNKITKLITELSNVHTNGKIISFLEGGYDLTALNESIKEHLIALNTS
ncbi:MAG: histone deacetylase family protein [Pelagibacteraceae bacterium]